MTAARELHDTITHDTITHDTITHDAAGQPAQPAETVVRKGAAR